MKTLPRYYDGGRSYLQLHDNRTLWKCTNEANSLDEFEFLVEIAIQDFEERAHEPLLLLGRSGRHVCVEDKLSNSRRYQWLRKIALDLEDGVINQFNAPSATRDIQATPL